MALLQNEGVYLVARSLSHMGYILAKFSVSHTLETYHRELSMSCLLVPKHSYPHGTQTSIGECEHDTW